MADAIRTQPTSEMQASHSFYSPIYSYESWNNALEISLAGGSAGGRCRGLGDGGHNELDLANHGEEDYRRSIVTVRIRHRIDHGRHRNAGPYPSVYQRS